jgi:hypothetical protein
MTVKLSSLRADLKREEDGDWVEYPDWTGVRFKVSSLNKPAYTIARDLLLQKVARKSKGKPQDRNKLTPEFGRLYADHILHDWEGFDEPYSPDLARQYLTNPEFRDLVAAVEWCASKVGETDVEFLEDAGKNSVPPSDGGSKDKSSKAGLPA